MDKNKGYFIGVVGANGEQTFILFVFVGVDGDHEAKK